MEALRTHFLCVALLLNQGPSGWFVQLQVGGLGDDDGMWWAVVGCHCPGVL